MVIASFDYNSYTPRFFSKIFSKQYPNIFDVKLREAVGGSAAAPTYFDPLSRKNGFGYEESLVDGGIICNNPVMYAFQIAKNIKKLRSRDEYKFNILSLGTGETPVEQD